MVIPVQKCTFKFIQTITFIVCIVIVGCGCNRGDTTPSESTNASISANTSNLPLNEVVVDREKQDKLENPKEYIQTEADIHFSFKYPKNFSFIMDDNAGSSAYVYLSENMTSVDYHAADIAVIVRKLGEFEYDNAQEFYQNRKNVISELAIEKLIQDVKWTDGKKAGYKLVFSFMWGPPIMIPEKEGASLENQLEAFGFVRVISKSIIFEFHNYVWEFSFTAPIEKYKKQEGILESVIDSLTIIPQDNLFRKMQYIKRGLFCLCNFSSPLYH